MAFDGQGTETYYVALKEILHDPAPPAIETVWRHPHPTQYEATIRTDTEAPWYVVTHDAYDAGWTATMHPKGGKPHRLRDHLIVDGYANAWAVGGPGSVTVRIEYEPQHWFRRGVWMTLATLGVALLTGLLSLGRWIGGSHAAH